MTGRLTPPQPLTLQARFDEVLTPENRWFIFNMSGVDYVSSGGLRVLLVITKIRVLKGGIILVNLHPFVEDSLNMAGFQALIPTAATEEEAIKILKKGGCMKVAIIGAGNIGTTLAYTLFVKGLVSEIANQQPDA